MSWEITASVHRAQNPDRVFIKQEQENSKELWQCSKEYHFMNKKPHGPVSYARALCNKSKIQVGLSSIVGEL